MDNCLLCNEYERYKYRIIFETKNFFITPSIGGFVEGYLLICSKRHYIGMSSLEPSLFEELSWVKNKVNALLSKHYSVPLFFEHGPIKDKRGICCINHAHLHAVPIEEDILGEITKNFKGRKINNLIELKKQQEKNIPYFYYENQKGEKFVFELEHSVPSQYMRQLIAVKIGKQELWDWRTNPCWENFHETLGKLKM